MRQDIERILKNRGYNELFYSITKSIYDLKKAGYTREETNETLQGIYSDDNGRLCKWIKAQLDLIY